MNPYIILVRNTQSILEIKLLLNYNNPLPLDTKTKYLSRDIIAIIQCDTEHNTVAQYTRLQKFLTKNCDTLSSEWYRATDNIIYQLLRTCSTEDILMQQRLSESIWQYVYYCSSISIGTIAIAIAYKIYKN